MSEKPEDWRSAVDSSTGRTYWYHRKTRVSTWIQPNFIVNEEIAPSTASPATSSSLISTSDQQEDYITKVESNIQLHKHSFREVLLRLSENTSSNLNDDVQFLAQHVFDEETMEPDNADTTISNLSLLVTNTSSGKCYNDQTFVRHTALLCLWKLANAKRRYYAGQHFYAYQSWTSLVKYIPHWILIKNNSSSTHKDVESVFILGALLSSLCVGPTYYLISEEDKDTMVKALRAVHDTDNLVNFNTLTTGVDAVLTERTIQTFTLLAKQGHRLPAVWILTIFAQSLSVEKNFGTVVRLGGLQALLSICCSKLDQELRAEVKELLLTGMASSAYLRDRVLTGLLDLSGDLDNVPVPLGPEPALYCSDGGAEEDRTQEQHLLAEAVVERETFEHTRYRHMIASGFCEIAPVDQPSTEGNDDPQNSCWNSFNRDVEWIPRSGTSWRLSSALLWARCPALRELITGFWDEGGGGLELSIDACDEVLACLCRYMHSGILVLPVLLARQLELLRVASELGMDALFAAVSEGLMLAVTMVSVPVIIAFCSEHGFEDLEQSCRKFLSTGGISPISIRLQGSSDMTGQNALLRDAIFSSLQDVNVALNQHPMSLSRLKVAAQTTNAIAADGTVGGTTGKKNQELILEELDGQPDDHFHSYDLSSMSLMDIATGDVTLSRGNSFSNSTNDPYCELNESFEQVIAQENSNRTASSSISVAKSASVGKSKPRKGSGGIYGLLLQKSDGAELYEGSGSGVAPMKTSRMPGKVVSNKCTTQQRRPVATDIDSTPRTQRATNLLASARPAADEYLGDFYDRDASMSPSRARDNPDIPSIKGQGCAQEFVKQMSLAPVREMTPSEKRLERLTRPTKVLGAVIQGADETENYDGTCEVELPISNAAESTPSEPAPLDNPQQQLKEGGQKEVKTTRAPGFYSKGLIALKRSVSPSTTASQSSRDGHLLSIGSVAPDGAACGGGDGIPYSPVPRSAAHDVRGSLTLLKTKAAGSRRRRSVAEIEGGQGQLDYAHLPDSAATTASSNDLTDTRYEGNSIEHRNIKQHSHNPTGLSNPARVELDIASFKPQEQDPDKAFKGVEVDADQHNMRQCPNCSRRFNPNSYEKHIKICADVFMKKRKTFDSAQMRTEANPDLKEFIENGDSKTRQMTGKRGKPAVAMERKFSNKGTNGPATSRWKENSAAFRAAMRSAREVTAAIAAGAPLPPPVISAPDPSLLQCQHCQRRFNPQAHERHVQVCQKIGTKPGVLKKGGGGNASNGGGSLAGTATRTHRGWQ